MQRESKWRASELVHLHSRGHLTAGRDQGHSSVLCLWTPTGLRPPTRPRDTVENEAFIRSTRKCISHRQRFPFSTPSPPDRLSRSPWALARQSQDLAFIGPFFFFSSSSSTSSTTTFSSSFCHCENVLNLISFANKVFYFFRAATISGGNQLRQHKIAEANIVKISEYFRVPLQPYANTKCQNPRIIITHHTT